LGANLFRFPQDYQRMAAAMNAGVVPPQWNWTEFEPGAWHMYGQHSYWQVKQNKVTGKWALGRRLGDPTKPVKLIAFFDTPQAAKWSAEAREASL
jgi:hypothetical protein